MLLQSSKKVLVIYVPFFTFFCPRTNYNTTYSRLWTRNKEQVGKQIIVLYYESFPYCESRSFIKLYFGKHQHSVIACFLHVYCGVSYWILMSSSLFSTCFPIYEYLLGCRLPQVEIQETLTPPTEFWRHLIFTVWINKRYSISNKLLMPNDVITLNGSNCPSPGLKVSQYMTRKFTRKVSFFF